MTKKLISRKLIIQIHQVLGLITGVVLFIVAITGCFWVFKNEIESTYVNYKNVNASSASVILPSKAKSIAQNVIGDKEIHGVVYGQQNEALEVVFYEAEPEFYQSVYINPYSGDVLEIVNHKTGFFAFMLDGHVRLWLPHAIGSRIVSYSILLFLVILISGLYLWWPKNSKARKQRFTFDWKKTTRWKRKNYDLHSIVGFYVGSFAFVLAFTGCVMAFDWFYYLTYKAAGGNKAPQFLTPNNTDVNNEKKNDSAFAIDELLTSLYEKYPLANNFELHYPTSDSTSILVEVSKSPSLYYNMDYLFFDQNTLEEIETTSIYGEYEDANFADKVIRMNYDIHVGSIGGIIGKIIAFLTSLIAATLPISGILLWYGKRYKNNID